VAPDPNQEVHGNQRDFPEHIEEDEVERHEHADQAKFEQQEQGVEFLDAFADVSPGNEDADGRQQRGEQHEPEAEAIQAHVITDLGRADPRQVGHEGELATRPVTRCQSERKEEGRGGESQRQAPQRFFVFPRQQEHDQETGQRKKQDCIQQVHRAPPARPAASKSRNDPSNTQAA